MFTIENLLAKNEPGATLRVLSLAGTENETKEHLYSEQQNNRNDMSPQMYEQRIDGRISHDS